MEKLGDSYDLDPSSDKLLWRSTLDDDVLKFKNVKPMLTEKTSKDLNKKGAPVDKYELSEAN